MDILNVDNGGASLHSQSENMLHKYGEDGRRWLNRLPALIERISKMWDLRGLNPMPNCSFNYILTGLRGTEPIVLKLNPRPCNLQKEAEALMAFENCGVVTLLEKDEQALLLERAIPGDSLKMDWPARELESVKIACECIKQLQKVSPAEGFPYVSQWFSALDEDWLAIPKHYLCMARELKNYLMQTAGPIKLLHGDLHHDNILRHGKRWLIIDPKGVVGEEIYELCAFIKNPMPNLLQCQDAAKLLQNRIHMFASLLHLDEVRIYQYCFVQIILSWIWNMQDGLNCDYFASLANMFAPLIPDL
ncbi:streptomycin phosphotransferase [Legionella jordanis]|uniref:aminoglycoside phosphotransferase family protein n=1 Tax=Legionella jordanis TaxID=456 RepID=UPI000EFEB986|nr:aminoglycoside phosphotransferase family protein [Legionella jordanis]RMX21016.1 streptomycin phosphotransferase [Legionella jordanis]